jgi:hypothetical protein
LRMLANERQDDVPALGLRLELAGIPVMPLRAVKF